LVDEHRSDLLLVENLKLDEILGYHIGDEDLANLLVVEDLWLDEDQT
jgi:hypothetical protein